MYLTANTYIPVPDRMVDTVLRTILKSSIKYQLSMYSRYSFTRLPILQIVGRKYHDRETRNRDYVKDAKYFP